MRRVSEPGIYTDMPAEDYFADPCPTPSFTQSIAKILINKSPLHAWHAHPRLNPAHEEDDDKKFDIGNVAHLLLLGRGKKIQVIEADDWRTKAAKDAREEARVAGRIGILGPQFERASAMAKAARKQLEVMDFDFADGDAEAVIAWREGDLWYRSMLDWLSRDRQLVLDFKTTIASAAPIAIPIKLAVDGWDIQSAMHERGLNALHPEGAGRRRHVFVCQECEEPYALSVSELTEGVLTMGRKKLAHAVALWQLCMSTNRWPGYPAEVLAPAYPGHLEARWLEREVAEQERAQAPRSNGFAADHMMAG